MSPNGGNAWRLRLNTLTRRACYSLHLVAAAANATWCEHMPWFEPLFHERMVVDADGMVALPDRAGVGFTFDWDAIAHYRIAL